MDRVIFEGVESLRLQYKGRKSYLSATEKAKVIQWLSNKDSWELEKLQLSVKQEYNIIFESNQSYYNLFKEAGISWKKAQKKNHLKDPELVATTQQALKKTRRVARRDRSPKAYGIYH